MRLPTNAYVQEVRKPHSIRVKPGIEYRSLYFYCILIRILRGFSAQQQLSSGPGVPETPSQMGFLQKCIFTRILPCRTGLAEVCRSKLSIQNGWNRVSGAPENLKIRTSKTLVFCVLFEPRHKNRILTRKIRIKINTKGGKKKCVCKKIPFEMGKNRFLRVLREIPFEMVKKRFWAQRGAPGPTFFVHTQLHTPEEMYI